MEYLCESLCYRVVLSLEITNPTTLLLICCCWLAKRGLYWTVQISMFTQHLFYTSLPQAALSSRSSAGGCLWYCMSHWQLMSSHDSQNGRLRERETDWQRYKDRLFYLSILLIISLFSQGFALQWRGRWERGRVGTIQNYSYEWIKQIKLSIQNVFRRLSAEVIENARRVCQVLVRTKDILTNGTRMPHLQVRCGGWGELQRSL